MGSFANSLFSLMLGWFQTVVASVWDLVAHPGKNSFLSWIAGNWYIPVAVLCLAGLAADFIVYMLRWKPYEVWKSFFRRIRTRRKAWPEDSEEAAVHYYNKSAEYTEEPENVEEAPGIEPEPIIRPEIPSEEIRSFTRQEKAERMLQAGGRRTRISRLLNDGEKGEYYPEPQELINAEEAYRRPVYPRRWRETEDKSE